MTDLITRFITWLNTAWLFIKRYWPVIVPTIVVLALALVAVTATATLQSCGCQGPTETPTPTVTVTPSPTPTPTITPMPGSEITGTVTMWWDWLPEVGQIYYHIDCETEPGAVIITCTGNYCPDGFPVTVVLTQSGSLEYSLWLDFEARDHESGAVLASTSVDTGIAGTAEPGTGQYDGVALWSWSPPVESGTLYDLWRRNVWHCDGLPDLPMTYASGMEMDERWFAWVGAYEVP